MGMRDRLGMRECSKTTLWWWLQNSVHLLIVTEFHNTCYTSLKLLNINSADKLVEAAFMSQSQYYSFRGALSRNIIQSTPFMTSVIISCWFSIIALTQTITLIYMLKYLLSFPWLKCKLHEGRYFFLSHLPFYSHNLG